MSKDEAKPKEMTAEETASFYQHVILSLCKARGGAMRVRLANLEKDGQLSVEFEPDKNGHLTIVSFNLKE